MIEGNLCARRSFLAALASFGLAATGTAGRLAVFAQAGAPARPHPRWVCLLF